MINFLRKLFLTRKADRRKTYTISIKPGEELPIEVWRYLVKRRAKFRCEDCGSDQTLESHHLTRPEDGGKNILRNGKCLCSKCHGKVHTIHIYVSSKDIVQSTLVKVFGKRLFKRYKTSKTPEEIERVLDEHSRKQVKRDKK